MSKRIIQGIIHLASENPTFCRRMIVALREKMGLVGLGMGQTLELPHSRLKIHRFANSLRVMDMTHAGKRGKLVPFFNLVWSEHGIGSDPNIITGLIDPILAASSYAEALAAAKELASEVKGERWPTVQTPESWGQDTYSFLRVDEDSYKAIAIAPMGAKIEFETPFVSVTSTPRDFDMDKKTQGQEARYKAWADSPAHAKKIFLWLKEPGVIASLQNLQFHELVSRIKEKTGQHVDSH